MSCHVFHVIFMSSVWNCTFPRCNCRSFILMFPPFFQTSSTDDAKGSWSWRSWCIAIRNPWRQLNKKLKLGEVVEVPWTLKGWLISDSIWVEKRPPPTKINHVTWLAMIDANTSPPKRVMSKSVTGKNVDAKLGGFCLDKFIFPLDFSGCFFFQKLAPLKPRFGLRTQDGAETGAQTAWQDTVVASVLWSASPVGAWDVVGLCWSTMINWAWEGSLVWMWRWNLLNPESPFLGWVLDMIFGSNWRSSDDKLVKHTPEVEMWSELHMKRHCKLWQDRELSQTEPSTPQKDSQKDSKGRGSLTIHFIFGLISWCMTGFHVVLRRV